MLEEIKKAKEIIKDINKKGGSILDIMIVDEIDCQLDEEITDEVYNLIYCKSRDAYLKSDDTDLGRIVRYCCQNTDKIGNLRTYDIIDRSWGS